MEKIRIFSGRSHPLLASEICRIANVKFCQAVVQEYANGCFEVFLQDKVKNCKVFLVQTSVPQTLHRDLWELLQMISAAKVNGASEVIVVMPYVSYARSDKIYAPGMAITGKLLVELLKASGMKRFIGIDFHSQELERFLLEEEIKTYHLSALSLLGEYLEKMKNLKDTILLAGDEGAIRNVSLLAVRLKIPIELVGFIKKTRISDTEVTIDQIDIEVLGKDVIIFDDEISPAATTLRTLAKELKKRGVKSIVVAVTHASITQDTIRRLQQLNMIRELIVNDTVPIPEEAKRLLPLRVLSVADLIAQKIKEISEES